MINILRMLLGALFVAIQMDDVRFGALEGQTRVTFCYSCKK